MNSQQAYDEFWNSFGVDAFEESTVPDDAFATRDAYITYTAASDEFDRTVSLTASVWRRSTKWKEITELAALIEERIGRGGHVVWYDGGGIWIKRGTPWAQRMSDTDPAIRRIFMNIEVEYFTTV